MTELEKAIIDIVTLALGLRPHLTEHTLHGLVKWRLSRG